MHKTKLLLLLMVFSQTSHADILACANAASVTTNLCRNSSRAAKAKADRLSTRVSQSSQGQGLQQTSETLAATTKQIEDIYKGASVACTQAIENCRSACAEDEGFAHACEHESGKYHAQLDPGRSEVKRGTAGASDASEQAHADGRDQEP